MATVVVPQTPPVTYSYVAHNQSLAQPGGAIYHTTSLIPHRHSVLSNEPKWMCCCRCCHVESVTLVLGWIMLVLAVPTLNPVHFVLSLCIILAQQKREPGLYLPFLIVQGIILLVATAIFIVIASSFVFGIGVAASSQNPEGAYNVLIGLVPIFVIFYLIIIMPTWLVWNVVYRAYKYMKEERMEAFGRARLLEQTVVTLNGPNSSTVMAPSAPIQNYV